MAGVSMVSTVDLGNLAQQAYRLTRQAERKIGLVVVKYCDVSFAFGSIEFGSRLDFEDVNNGYWKATEDIPSFS
jgi:hypothetical protein